MRLRYIALAKQSGLHQPSLMKAALSVLTFALTAVGVVAGAADLHHVNLGRVLTLLAAILAALRRGAAAGLSRALVLRLLVSHLVPPSCKRRGRGCYVTQVSSRRAENARRKDEG